VIFFIYENIVYHGTEYVNIWGKRKIKEKAPAEAEAFENDE